jgi:predicted lipid-binding transport protein (Tim44 family)
MFSVMDPLNLILLAVAAVVVWRLWSVLGTRTGFEKPPIVLRDVSKAEQPPNQKSETLEGDVLPPEDAKPVWHGHAAEGSSLAKGLEALAARSVGFTVPSFLRGANSAYELVLEAYAAADKPALKNLLSRDMFDSFSAAIDERAKAGQSMKMQFVGVKKSEIKEATMLGNKAQVAVAFAGDMISATLDKSGACIDGDEKAIRTVTDLWTFERDVTARDPNWKLVATDDDI